MMDPHLSLTFSLLISLGLWWGSMRATLEGNLDLPSSGLRFLLAFLLARGAVGLINLLVKNYRDASIKTLVEETLNEMTRLHAIPDDQTETGRRKSDVAPVETLKPEQFDPGLNAEVLANELLDTKRNEFEAFQASNRETFPEP